MGEPAPQRTQLYGASLSAGFISGGDAGGVFFAQLRDAAGAGLPKLEETQLTGRAKLELC